MRFEKILEAQRKLRGIASLTPVIVSNHFQGLFYKAENLQKTGSFKIRAAYNQVVSLSVEELNRGIVTSSSGNFAQGAACAASLMNTSAKIVMMSNSNPIKVRKTREMGGEVIFCENRFEARQEMVNKIKESENRTEIHPYDTESVVAGNGTIGLEILDQLPGVQNVVIPISGGGLISGIAFAIKSLKPAVKIWGVQPLLSNATYRSFQEGRPISIEKARTIADGLQVTSPGKITFPLVQKYVDDIVTVEEETILQAVKDLILDEKLVVEPSGAVPLAAQIEGKVPSNNTVCVLSGGNIDPRVIHNILNIETVQPLLKS